MKTLNNLALAVATYSRCEIVCMGKLHFISFFQFVYFPLSHFNTCATTTHKICTGELHHHLSGWWRGHVLHSENISLGLTNMSRSWCMWYMLSLSFSLPLSCFSSSHSVCQQLHTESAQVNYFIA
jgi:hypothetical protein